MQNCRVRRLQREQSAESSGGIQTQTQVPEEFWKLVQRSEKLDGTAGQTGNRPVLMSART